MSKDLLTDVNNCARCGGKHPSLYFKALQNPTDEWGYWTMCPNNQEPIMLAVLDDEEDE